ncbi:MAG: OmpA family protein [Bacteroidota bacterium]|nr:OmpA family protein [Bacteroidota bacterium]
MKKISILLLGVFCSIAIYAQNADKKWAIEALFGKNEYNGDIANDYFKWNKTFYGMGGLGLNFYLDKNFDGGFQATYGKYGSWVNSTSNFLGKKFDLSGLLRYKLNNGYILPENSFFAPYLTAGFGYVNYSGGPKIYESNTAIIPLGVGLKFNFSKTVALQYQWLFNFNASDRQDFKMDNKDDNFMKHSVGLVISFGGKKDKDNDGVLDKYDLCPNTPLGVKVDAKGCPIDSDGDGVADYLDKCPNTPAGVKVDANGCPLDSDGDGVPDYLDKCPNTPAGVQVDAKGCPIDSDGDGVPDYLDKCPNTPAGVQVDANGCPLDRDGDGVPDYLDKCPDVKGVIENKGCPEVKQETKEVFKKALQGIQFATGKDVILPKSFPILDNVVSIMKENPAYLLDINGHTDNVGKPEANQILSEKRAAAVKAYLVQKGISADRLKAAGFGDKVPVADNKTAAGRQQNRRVEFKVNF